MTTFVHKGGGGSKLPEILSTWFVHGPNQELRLQLTVFRIVWSVLSDMIMPGCNKDHEKCS